MEDLPKIYIEEVPEEQKRSKVAISIMVLLLLAMPLGVFLTLRSQNTNSQAAVEQTSNQPESSEASITLLPRVQSINNQMIFPVDVVVRSDSTFANLFIGRISFPADKLEVVSIASNSADLTDTSREYITKEWLDASFNNQEGFVNLVGGTPNPGIKTRSGSPTASLLATIYFKAKSIGSAEITLQDGSMIFSQEDNANLMNKAQSATISINESGGDFIDRTFEQQARNLVSESSPSGTLKVTSPNGGEVLSYYKPITITWQTEQPESSPAPRRATGTIQTKTRLSIFMNGEFLGQLAETSGEINHYVWIPSKTLPTSYIKPENKFQIEIIKEENGVEQKTRSAGPFNLVLSETTTAITFTPETLTIDRTDINGDGSVDFRDASFVLRHYLAPVTEQNKKADINNDRVINSIDLYYLKQSIKF
jgi:hypothetical protein